MPRGLPFVALLALTPLAAAQPPADGPWRHEVHVVTSDDGLAFTETAKPLLQHASVPDIIVLDRALPKGGGARGDVLVYVVDASGNRKPGMEEITRLASTDGGRTWGRAEPVRLEWPQRGDHGAAVDPAIVQLEDGRLRLYFLAMPRAQPDGRDPEHKWPPEDRPPITPDHPNVPDPDRKPGWPDTPTPPDKPGRPDRPEHPPPKPTGPSPEARTNRICSAISDDGLHFTVEKEASLEAERLTDPEVVKVGDEWLMFLSRGDEVALARSTDGLKFEIDRTYVLRGGGVPGAVPLGDGRVRIYQSGPNGITSVVFDAKTGMFRPEEGVRIAGRCADPAVWPRPGGGYIGVIKRWMDESR